ncbi:MAG: phage tail protein [Sphingomonadaceae bacterium]
MPQALLTDLAINKIRDAAGSAAAVAISHVALGDGLGANYDAAASQTSLRRELARVAIASRTQIGARSWQVKAEFPPETPVFTIREIGFFDNAGALIAIVAGTDFEARQAGTIAYIIQHVLNFSRVGDGLIIIEAPDDEVLTFHLLTLASQARQDTRLFNLSEAHFLAHGAYA